MAGSILSPIRPCLMTSIRRKLTRPGAAPPKNGGPYKGRLNNSLAVYPETLNLKLEITLQPVGMRPLFKIQEETHPLAIEQQSGITCKRAMELVALLMHGKQ